jgi:hypothetical protein
LIQLFSPISAVSAASGARGQAFGLKLRRGRFKTRADIIIIPARTMTQTVRLDLAKRTRLKALISAKSVLTGGDFKLASGGKSSVFFDMKMTLPTPRPQPVADLILQLLERERFDAIGGPCRRCPSSMRHARPSGAPHQRSYVRKSPSAAPTVMIEVAAPAPPRLVEDHDQGSSVLRAARGARRMHGRDRGDARSASRAPASACRGRHGPPLIMMDEP